MEYSQGLVCCLASAMRAGGGGTFQCSPNLTGISINPGSDVVRQELLRIRAAFRTQDMRDCAPALIAVAQIIKSPIHQFADAQALNVMNFMDVDNQHLHARLTLDDRFAQADRFVARQQRGMLSTRTV